jgi:hypothetical protein
VPRRQGLPQCSLFGGEAKELEEDRRDKQPEGDPEKEQSRKLAAPGQKLLSTHCAPLATPTVWACGAVMSCVEGGGAGIESDANGFSTARKLASGWLRLNIKFQLGH